VKRARLLDRRVNKRDASIVLIATEGEETEPRYFEALQESAIIDRSRARLIVIPPAGGASAPTRVIAALKERSEYAVLEPRVGDRACLVLDVDRWPKQQLASVAADAERAGIVVAVSNPCFELWLLLHVGECPPEWLGVEVSTAAVCDRWRARVNGASKSTIPSACISAQAVRSASDRARTLDTTPADRWPQTTGTHVFKVLEGIFVA